MVVEKTSGFGPKDMFMFRFSEDPVYQTKVLSNYEFARKEFSRAGMKIDKETHKKMKDALQILRDSSSSVFGQVIRNRIVWIGPPPRRQVPPPS